MRPSTTLDPTATVHEIITLYPATAAVFARFGVDTCCGGNASLVEVAHRDGVDVDALLAAIRTVVEHG